MGNLTWNSEPAWIIFSVISGWTWFGAYRQTRFLRSIHHPEIIKSQRPNSEFSAASEFNFEFNTMSQFSIHDISIDKSQLPMLKPIWSGADYFKSHFFPEMNGRLIRTDYNIELYTQISGFFCFDDGMIT